MAVKYADRAFISVNGVPILDIQSASLKQNDNAREVPSMTPDGFNRGYVRGNRVSDLTITVATRNQQSSPKLENIDYENNDVQATFQVGADIYVCKDLFYKDREDNAGGVGDEVKQTHNFGVIRTVDAVGNSVLFDLQL